MSGGTFGTNWLDLSNATTTNLFVRTYVQGFVDISGGNLIVRNNNLYLTGGDSSLNGRLLVGGDASLNSRLYVGSDVSFGGRIYAVGDVSLNSRLNVGSDASFGGRLFLNSNSLYVNGTLFTGGTNYFTSDVSMTQRLYVGTDVSMGGRLFVTGDASLNNRLFVTGDTSLNSRLFVGNDVSMGGRLFVTRDISMNGNFYGNNINFNTIAVSNNINMAGVVQQFGVNVGLVPASNTTLYNMNSYVQYSNGGYTDISLNGRLFLNTNSLYVGGSVFSGGSSYFAGDVSVNNRLLLVGDASMNSRLFVGSDVSMGGNLFTVGDTSHNARLFVGSDVSMGGRLFVANDTSFGGNILVKGNVNGIYVGLGGANNSTNAALGVGALLSNTSASYAVAIGANAFRNCSNPGNQVAVGGNALVANTGGVNNCAVGGYSLSANNNSNNTSVGTYAMQSQTGGTNTAVGWNTIKSGAGNQNTGVGAYAIQSAAGSNNSALGYFTLPNLTTGANNAALGDNTGTTNTTGNYNTYVGSGANTTGAAFSNSTALGYSASITGSNQIVLGTTAETIIGVGDTSLNRRLYVGGNVGVGTSSPAFPLTIYSNSAAATPTVATTQYLLEGRYTPTAGLNGSVLASGIRLLAPVTGFTAPPSNTGWVGGEIVGGVNTGTDHYLMLNTFNAGTSYTRMTITGNNGYVGIGVTPSYPLHVTSSGVNATYGAYFQYYNGFYTTASTQGCSIYTAGGIGGGLIGAVSDKRIKKNIVDIDDGVALDILRQLEPKRYNYVDEVHRGSEVDWGFIAQDVRKVFPSSILISKDFVPNLYEVGTVSSDGTVVTLTDKSVNDISMNYSPLSIKFYNNSNNEIEKEIDQIIDDKTFTLKTSLDQTDLSGNQIFIYGQKVDDFHTLSKDAVFTIATAAVQQIDREFQQAKQTIKDLQTQLADVLARLSAAGIP